MRGGKEVLRLEAETGKAIFQDVKLFYRSNVEFFSEITISSRFTAECGDNAKASENPCVDWNVLKLGSLGDKSVGF
ncbi:hypothetical protein C5S31_02860 [ANME-1 cluster archaeon GoMg2]|nr:hypothetical protein [ANME-1 cluster archaeon GoMg2]